MKFIAGMLFLAIGALASPVAPEAPAMADAMAAAQDGYSEPYSPCSSAGFFGTSATCCSFDIIGAASLGCTPPARNPRSPAEFKALCGNKKPKCCFVDPVGGIVNAICPNPVGFD